MNRLIFWYSKKSGQAILEYVVFLVMFAFAIMAFSHNNFISRVIQGRMRASVSQAFGVEQFNLSSSVHSYNPNVTLYETPPDQVIVAKGDGAYEKAEIQSLNPWPK